MDKLKFELNDLVGRENLVGIYIATADGELLLHVTGPQSAVKGHIQQYLFGGLEEIKSSYKGLENMSLPQMYAQGEERAVYSKLHGLLYGVFYVGNMSVLDHWNKSKSLSNEIESIINNSPTLSNHING